MAAALRAFRRAATRHDEGKYKPARLSASFESVKEALADEAVLLDFAPIFDVKDDTAGIAFIQKVLSTPNAVIAELQADDLAPVWAALETANAGLAQVEEPGRADIPFEAAKLHALSLDVAKYLNIAQTQLPVIMPDFVADSDELKERMNTLIASLGVKTLACDLAFVSGAKKEAVARVDTDDETEEERESRFGFMTIRSREPSKSKALPYEEKLLALPVITIDREVLAYAANQSGGEGFLRDLQQIVGIVNHDYFHHLTARIISPYFSSLKEDTLDFYNTPFAQLLGNDLISESDLNKPLRASYVFSLRAERQMPFHDEHYKTGATWENLFGQQPYEFHALHLHRRLYQEHLDKGPQGEEMRQRLDSLFSALKSLPFAPERSEAHNLADITKLYFSALVYSNLLRIVDHTHPLAQQCEKLIDGLNISPALLKREKQARIARTDIGRFAEVDYISGIEGGEPKGGAGEQLRWQAYIMNARDTNRIHMKDWGAAQDKSLPAMRFFLSAVQRDIQLAKWRGGPEALDATRDAINRDKPEIP